MNRKDFVIHPALCALPWTGIYVNPDGTIKNCAINQESLGNIHDINLEQLLNNDVTKSIRQDMLQGRRHERCNACYKVEDNAANKISNESNRTWYKKIAIRQKIDLDIFDHVDRFQPTVLDLRWRNTCNRACVYCGPDLSSLWEDLLEHEYKIDDQVLAKSQQYVIDNLHTVKHVYLAGGEPLLIKENQSLLEHLLAINPDVEIRVNSNLGNIRTPVFELLKHFTNVHWTVSVDSMDQSFGYMRWPGDWSEFVSNLDHLRSMVGDRINFNMVWCILNYLDIMHTIDFLLDKGYQENMFIVQCLTTPSSLSVLNLPAEEKQKIQQVINQKLALADPKFWLHQSLTSMHNFLHNTLSNHDQQWFGRGSITPGLPGTFQLLDMIDRVRGTDSSKIFLRLYQLAV